MSGLQNIGQSQPGAQQITFTYQFDPNGRPTILKYQSDLPGAVAYLQRVRAGPGMDPATDPTINHIQSQEEPCVADLMQAFFDVSSVDDRTGSNVIGYCTLGNAHAYNVEDVEATCRLVHSKLIQRCRYSFRGYEGSDRLGRRQSGIHHSQIEDEDISGNCYTRFTNVLTLLRKWKSICGLIVESNSEIEGLVNAPATMLGDKFRSQQGNRSKKAKKEKIDEDLEAAKLELAQARAQTRSIPTLPSGALRGPGPTVVSHAAAQLDPPQGESGLRPSTRRQNRGGPSPYVPNSTGQGSFPNIDPPSYQASSKQNGVEYAPSQRASAADLNAQAAYGLDNHSPQYHNTNHFENLHYQLHSYGIPIDPGVLSPHSALSNVAGSNPVFGNSYGSAFGNGPVSGNIPDFGNGRDAAYSTSMPPGIANQLGQSNMLPSYDAGQSSISNQAALSDMGTDAELMHAMNVVKQGSINFNRNTFANYQDYTPGNGYVSDHHLGRPSGPSSQLDHSGGPVADPLSGPSMLLNGPKRSRQQSKEPEEHPPARRQKIDDDGAGQRDLVDEDNEDAEDGDVGDDADGEHESISSEPDSYDGRLPGEEGDY